MKARINILAPSVAGKKCAIVNWHAGTTAPAGGDPYLLYTLDASGLADTLAATSPDPRRLSEYALASGALSVRHDYDLRAADDSRC